jgi:tRNA threonylcarbamoyladenosine biosynthesis protein TsaE
MTGDKKIIIKEEVFFIHSPEDMTIFGEGLAVLLMAGDVLLLDGDLGAGKTTLTQAIAGGLGVGADYPVTSPSFALLHEYQGRLPLYHMDCYRLDGEDDIEDAGLSEYIGKDDGISVVEWAKRLGWLAPSGSLYIDIKVIDEIRRKVICRGDEEKWAERLDILKQ